MVKLLQPIVLNKRLVYQSQWSFPEEALPSNYCYLMHLMLRDCNLIPPIEINKYEPYLNLNVEHLKLLSVKNSMHNLPKSYLGEVKKQPRKILTNEYIQKPWGITLGFQNMCFISSRHTNAIVIFDYKTGEFLGKIGEDHAPSLQKNLNQACHGRNAVSNPNGAHKMKVINDLNTEINFRKPAGICTIPDKHWIIICDKDNHRIQIIHVERNFHKSPARAISFKLIQIFGQRGKEDGQFEYPWGNAYNLYNRMIAVADSKNFRVQLFNSKGVFLSKFTAMGATISTPINTTNNNNGSHNLHASHSNTRFERMQNQMHSIANFTPRSLKFVPSNIDNDFYCDRLLVTDFESHRIVVIDLDLVEETGKGSNNKTQGVGHNNKYRVKLKSNFKYQGSLGKSIGRFERPQGITTDRYGNWLIVDSKNSRIQILGNDGQPKLILIPEIFMPPLPMNLQKREKSEKDINKGINLSDISWTFDGTIGMIDMDNNCALIY